MRVLNVKFSSVILMAPNETGKERIAREDLGVMEIIG
jgi:hypothetical protein